MSGAFRIFCAEMLEDEETGRIWDGFKHALNSSPSWPRYSAFQRAASADPHRVTHTENPGVRDKDKWKAVI